MKARWRSDGPFSISDKEVEYMLPDSLREQIAALNKKAEELKKNAPPSRIWPTQSTKAEPVEQHVFFARESRKPRRSGRETFPVILAGDHQTRDYQQQRPSRAAHVGSSRKDNPLPSA